MISFSNLCKEHHLPLKYICVSERCGCIAKRYCHNCADNHQRNYYRKCVLEQAICKNIKSCIAPYAKISADCEVMKKNCLLIVRDREKKCQQAKKKIAGQLQEYVRAIKKKAESLQKFLGSQKKTFNSIITTLNLKYINSLRKNQLLVPKVNLASAKGLEHLAYKVATCQILLKNYDQFLQSAEKYGDSVWELRLGLGAKDNLFKDGLKAVLGQNKVITALTNNRVEYSAYKENKVERQRKPNIPKPNQAKKLFETPTKPKASNKQNDFY